MPNLRLAALACCVLTTGAVAQSVSITFPAPGSFGQAIGISPGGEFVVGGGGFTTGFVYSDAAGLDPTFSEKFLRFIVDEVIRHHNRAR